MNILICDDLQSDSGRLSRLIRDSWLDLNIVVFQNGYDALDYFYTGAVVDVCFLDIIMPEMSGVELAGQLRQGGYTGDIVFLTTSNEYAAESYDVNAFSYLLKPPSPEGVRGVLQKLEDAKKKGDTEGILVRVSKVSRNVLFRDISHVEVIKHYVYFRLTDGEEIELYATFGEIAEQLLRDNRFVQCHRSYIVNMSEISSIDDKEITVRGGKKLPVSKSYSNVKKKFAKWMIGEVS